MWSLNLLLSTSEEGANDFWLLLLNNINPVKFIVLYIYGLIGIISAFMLDLFGKWKKIKQKGGFKFSYWFEDNWARLILSLFILFVGIVTTSELVGTEPSVYNALLTGLSTDKVIKTFLRRSKNYGDD
jgi:hypothetical protein